MLPWEQLKKCNKILFSYCNIEACCAGVVICFPLLLHPNLWADKGEADILIPL